MYELRLKRTLKNVTFFLSSVSVNVRGFGDSDKKGWVKSIINEERSDVIGVQETKCGMVDK